MCRQDNIQPTTAPAFGKLVKRAFPAVECHRKSSKGRTINYYKNLARKNDETVKAIEQISKLLDNNAPSDGYDAAAEYKRNLPDGTSLLLNLLNKNEDWYGFGNGLPAEMDLNVRLSFAKPSQQQRRRSSVRMISCPNLVGFFHGMSDDIADLAVRFGACFEGFWRDVYSILLEKRDINLVAGVFRAFWSCVLHFQPLFANLPFRHACDAAEEFLYMHLNDMLMSNPFQMDHSWLAMYLNEIGHFFPAFMQRSLESVELDDAFVMARMERICKFADILLKRALFVLSLECNGDLALGNDDGFNPELLLAEP